MTLRCLKLTILLIVNAIVFFWSLDVRAECSQRCKKLKKAQIVAIKSDREYLQKDRDMLVVKSKAVAIHMGYSPFEQCSSESSKLMVSGAKSCAPVVLSTRDASYLCPNQVKPFKNIAKAENKGFSAYTACGDLTPLPSATPTPTPTPQVSPLPSSRSFSAEDGERLSDVESVSVVKLSSGGFRAYVAKSHSSFDGETVYRSDSADGLTFGALSAITGIAPGSGSETFVRPAVQQFSDDSFGLIYEKVKHISSAGLDLISLMRAVSPNGTAFSNSPSTVVVQNGSSLSSTFDAHVVRVNDSVLRMYFGKSTGYVMVESTDNGATWGEESEVTVLGTEASYAPYPGEFSLIIESDESYTLYFSSPFDDSVNNQSIFSAESDDGLIFTVHNQALLIASGDKRYSAPHALKLDDSSIRLYYTERTGSFDAVTRVIKSLLSDS